MYQIVTDSCCDLPYQVLEEINVDFLSMKIQLNGEELIDDLGKTFDYEKYMNELKGEAMPTTSQINVGGYLEFFRSYVEKKIPVLYVAFSSSMSGSYSSAMQAVELLKEEYENPEIYVFDTKAASVGEGLLVLAAARLKEEGKPLEEVLEWLNNNYLKVRSWVTVDDLKHLERGGRISKTSATLGSILSVKPIITVDEAGRLTNVDKVRGRNKSIQKIVDETIQSIVAPLEQTIYIAYAGDLESAEKAKKQLEEKIQVKNIVLYPLGPTIASHTGYGCIAIFSMGTSR
ncbi:MULTISPECIES: DegV family protein [Enterococcus]|uniref:Fatty acid-binding protein DegV n=1 Tax=Enterococcus thailandicus TaxID=417368 RepID=A0A179ESS9_ENTTH|nr:DegV family protein [Enterococcus thailandicus]ASZ06398.1 DegV family protein [Enterococcus thailandicus]MDA3964783.1 DegV family protein [Enterococcus thailandicus]MDK4352294.1 DegV family protein [Enterococcus thailandicus]MDT2735042.1 DegV family protein [Enterococcus thailandicus]MDT2794705.1 DegV family protein [Enterococcus thailandicus]